MADRRAPHQRPEHGHDGHRPGRRHSYATNRVLLHGHRMHLENLHGLDKLPPAGGWIIVGGTRIARGSGSPATVFGLIP